MARLTAISGLGRKSAAIFLLEHSGRRLLLDLGAALEAGERPDLSSAGRVDAVLLSHAHIDHHGGLDRLDELGNPPVFATAETLRHLPPDLCPAAPHPLPLHGVTQVLGLPLQTGQAGHAPGGIWLHMPTEGGGFLYTGDFSTEAQALPFDPFPKAATVLADASYGDRDDALTDQVGHIAEAARAGAVLPAPSAGRGPDMIEALEARGLKIHACAAIAAEMRALRGRSVPVVGAHDARPDQVIVAAGSIAESGLPAALLARTEFRLIFSSHVPRSSPAHAAVSAGRARWMPWNVHPRRRDLLAMAEHCEARQVIPAFTDLAKAPLLCRALGARLIRETPVEV
ncbi:MBL fold metallo-hydrolase [Paracoccus alkanivorans]|uniref:MBL fold metallo-hydrolase n=1 Tax=Paracoccus alkanivorans TaxID=2116655 RepID=A0A3M0M264_9RHOB|nr:MBL fold metallo-hydrolase [Paracoccus alkanivorans]RMC31571.1 MBL fold metallo-hydrolase [Paracoccus alkanivorans]